MILTPAVMRVSNNTKACTVDTPKINKAMKTNFAISMKPFISGVIDRTSFSNMLCSGIAVHTFLSAAGIFSHAYIMYPVKAPTSTPSPQKYWNCRATTPPIRAPKKMASPILLPVLSFILFPPGYKLPNQRTTYSIQVYSKPVVLSMGATIQPDFRESENSAELFNYLSYLSS